MQVIQFPSDRINKEPVIKDTKASIIGLDEWKMLQIAKELEKLTRSLKVKYQLKEKV
jgi:hypothetical protein